MLAGPWELLTRFDHVTKQLSAAQSSASLAKEYDHILTSLTLADVWSLEARIDEVLAGLGLGQLTGRGRQRALGSLSPCLLYTSPSPRDLSTSRMPSSA